MNKENDMIVVQDTFIVYGAESCPACKQVVQLLNQKNKTFIYKSFGMDYELQELIDLGITSREVSRKYLSWEKGIF